MTEATQTIVERLEKEIRYLQSGGASGIVTGLSLSKDAKAEIERLQARVRALEAELSEAIEGWADGANYKGEYLKAKHGDEVGIAKARAVIQSSGGK